MIRRATSAAWRITSGPVRYQNAGVQDGDGGNGRRAGRALSAGLGVLVALGATLAAWWLIGDQSTAAGPPDSILWSPPLTSTGERGLALLGVVLAVSGVGAVIALVRSGRIAVETLWGWPPGIAGCVLLAWCWRLMTASVAGANQGAGPVLLFGSPLVLFLLGVGAALIAFAPVGSGRPSDGPG